MEYPFLVAPFVYTPLLTAHVISTEQSIPLRVERLDALRDVGGQDAACVRRPLLRVGRPRQAHFQGGLRQRTCAVRAEGPQWLQTVRRLEPDLRLRVVKKSSFIYGIPSPVSPFVAYDRSPSPSCHHLGDLHDGLRPGGLGPLQPGDGGGRATGLVGLSGDGAQVRDQALRGDHGRGRVPASCRSGRRLALLTLLTTSLVSAMRSMSCCSPGDRP